MVARRLRRATALRLRLLGPIALLGYEYTSTVPYLHEASSLVQLVSLLTPFALLTKNVVPSYVLGYLKKKRAVGPNS